MTTPPRRPSLARTATVPTRSCRPVLRKLPNRGHTVMVLLLRPLLRPLLLLLKRPERLGRLEVLDPARRLTRPMTDPPSPPPRLLLPLLHPMRLQHRRSNLPLETGPRRTRRTTTRLLLPPRRPKLPSLPTRPLPLPPPPPSLLRRLHLHLHLYPPPPPLNPRHSSLAHTAMARSHLLPAVKRPLRHRQDSRVRSVMALHLPLPHLPQPLPPPPLLMPSRRSPPARPLPRLNPKTVPARLLTLRTTAPPSPALLHPQRRPPNLPRRLLWKVPVARPRLPPSLSRHPPNR